MKRIINIVVVPAIFGFFWLKTIFCYNDVFWSNSFIGIIFTIYGLLMTVWTALWVDGVFEFFKKPSKQEALRGTLHLILLPVSPFIIIYTIFEELYYYAKNNNKKNNNDSDSNLFI